MACSILSLIAIDCVTPSHPPAPACFFGRTRCRCRAAWGSIARAQKQPRNCYGALSRPMVRPGGFWGSPCPQGWGCPFLLGVGAGPFRAMPYPLGRLVFFPSSGGSARGGAGDFDLILNLNPPGCGALFLLRAAEAPLQKQTAAPAPPRLFLPQAAARLRSPPPLAVPPRLRRRPHTGALNHRLLLLFAGCTAAAKIPCLPAAAQLPNMGEAKDSKPSPCQGAGPQGKLAKRKRF